MEQNNIYHLIILDESGSMASIEREAIDGLNETLGGIRAAQKDNPEQNHFVSIVSFEGNGMKGVKTIRDRVPIENIENIRQEEYHPGACTPLYDAMGYNISRLDRIITPRDGALVTIITDGMENSSEIYSREAISTLVGRQREKGWTFAYIGANQDAVEVARELNIRNAMNFRATSEGTREMSDVLCRSMVNYCYMDPRDRMDSANFFEGKRKKRNK